MDPPVARFGPYRPGAAHPMGWTPLPQRPFASTMRRLAKPTSARRAPPASREVLAVLPALRVHGQAGSARRTVAASKPLRFSSSGPSLGMALMTACT